MSVEYQGFRVPGVKQWSAARQDHLIKCAEYFNAGAHCWCCGGGCDHLSCRECIYCCNFGDRDQKCRAFANYLVDHGIESARKGYACTLSGNFDFETRSRVRRLDA